MASILIFLKVSIQISPSCLVHEKIFFLFFYLKNGVRRANLNTSKKKKKVKKVAILE